MTKAIYQSLHIIGLSLLVMGHALFVRSGDIIYLAMIPLGALLLTTFKEVSK